MRKGFTLIELLVVIAIIGLIGSVALANFQDARQKARIAASKQFNATIRSGLGDRLTSTWNLDEDTGSSLLGRGSDPDVFDNSGNNLNGYMNGVDSIPDGINGSAMYFDGNAYIWGEHFPSAALNSELTVSAWIKPEDITGDHIIFALADTGDGTCGGISVGVSNGKANVNGVDTTGYSLVNNIWQHIAFVFHTDASNNQVVDTYLNGNKVGSTSGIHVNECPDGNWSIGSLVSFSGGEPGEYEQGFVGAIDDMSVFQGAF